MRGSGSVDVTGVTQSGVGSLIVTGVLDADGYAEERSAILFTGGGRIVREKLRDAVRGSVCFEGLPEEDVSDDGRRGSSDRARVDDLRQRETENVLLRGNW